MCKDFKRQAGAEMTDVSEKMLVAARPFLWDEQVSSHEDRDEVLSKIYRAMVNARDDPS